MDMNYIFFMAESEGLLEDDYWIDYEDALDECGVEDDELSDPEIRYGSICPF